MRCAVLGVPIAHSLSPALHAAAYAHLGLDWTYEAVEVDSLGLADFLESRDRTWRGLSLTMPLKRIVVPLVGEVDSWVQLSGVANTVVFEKDRRLGFNTDIPGAVAAVRERVHELPRSAVVLGGGATATSVLLALTELGCTTARLLVRDPARAAETLTAVARHPQRPALTVGDLADPGVLDADVVVSTIPGGAQTPELVAAAASVPTVFEVVYDPWPTPIAQAATESGQVLVTGLDLLAHQAVLQVDLMTGEAVPVELVRAAGRDELERRAVQNRTARL